MATTSQVAAIVPLRKKARAADDLDEAPRCAYCGRPIPKDGGGYYCSLDCAIVASRE